MIALATTVGEGWLEDEKEEKSAHCDGARGRSEQANVGPPGKASARRKPQNATQTSKTLFTHAKPWSWPEWSASATPANQHLANARRLVQELCDNRFCFSLPALNANRRDLRQPRESRPVHGLLRQEKLTCRLNPRPFGYRASHLSQISRSTPQQRNPHIPALSPRNHTEHAHWMQMRSRRYFPLYQGCFKQQGPTPLLCIPRSPPPPPHHINF